MQQLGQALRHLLDAEQEGLALLGREAAAPSRHELVTVRIRVGVRIRLRLRVRVRVRVGLANTNP